MQLILASSSPARKDLLERLQIPFQTCTPDIDESPLDNENTTDMVQRLSLLKSKAAIALHPDSLIIGSDCVGEIDGYHLQKPITKETAFNQLEKVSGKKVRFVTGLCLYNAANDSYQLGFEEYFVYYRKFTTNYIENYLEKASDNILFCAGSFQAEKLGITLVEKFSGNDFTSLIGLPLIRLTDMLIKEGFK